MDVATNVGNDGKPIPPLRNTKTKTRRGKGKGGSSSFKLSILGNNANGLQGKLDSLNSLIHSLNSPSIVTIQESKVGSKKLKIPGYNLFWENRAKVSDGGGLLTAVSENLSAIQVSEGLDDILVVEVSIDETAYRVINFYGPQEPQNDSEQILVRNFWLEVEKQILEAKNKNCKLILQGDANAKLGKEIFPRDLHKQTFNGAILYDLVSRHDLFILNLDEKCDGLITRHRDTVKGLETSVIDYIIVCEEIMTKFEKMIIDEKREHVLTKYSTKKGIQTRKTSDHNIMYAQFAIKFKRAPTVVKRELFNFKDREGQTKFHNLTENTDSLSSCFMNDSVSFEDQSKKFMKTLNSTFHQCFTKVRVTNKSQQFKKDEIQILFEKKSQIIEFLTVAKSRIMINWLNVKKESIEIQICALISAKNAGIIREQVGCLNLDGQFSRQGLWKVKSKLFPTITEPLLAKKDIHGNLVTAVQPLKDLYLRTYVQRLSDRPMKEDMSELRKLKTELWEGRLSIIKDRRTKDWTLKDLDKVLKHLKNNQTRDPNEMINEIFKPPVIGKDLKLAILYLMNGIKANLKIPSFLQVANITTISKKNGSKFDMDGERGIFILSVFRKIFDRLLFNDKYHHIEESMSDSNIGARKNQSIKNHLFVLYGVINYVLYEEKSNIDICIYDIKKCFDALWLEDVLNDMYDSVTSEEHDDKLALIFEANKNNYVAVKTSVGLTKRVNIQKIVTQGGTFGPIECSNSIDKVGQKSFIEEADNLYLYKKLVKIPPLGFVDDILTVAKCGNQSLSLNSFVNTQIETKKLQFHTPDAKGKSKCHSMHVGKKSLTCPELKVHGVNIDKVEAESYLGDIIESNGKNSKTIQSRVNKGLGIISHIMVMLETITLGEHYFQSAMLLRESLFINGVLTNAEVWYGVSSSDLKPLIDLDKSLLRKIFNTPISTPIESLYLELGCLDIETLLKARRIKYLHYILQMKPTSMLQRFFMAQWKYSEKHDWAELVRKDLTDFDLSTELQSIKSMTEFTLKGILRKKTREFALNKFLKMKSSHSKLVNLEYTELKLQDYLKSNDFSVEEARTVFAFRTKMANFSENYRHKEGSSLCPLCGNHLDAQELAFGCPVVIESISIRDSFEDLYTGKVSKHLADTLKRILELRTKDNLPV